MQRVSMSLETAVKRWPSLQQKGNEMRDENETAISEPEAIQPELLDEVDAEVIEDGKMIFAVIKWRGITVKERIPVHIHKLGDESQAELLDGAQKRLKKRIVTKLTKAYLDAGGVLDSPKKPEAAVAARKARLQRLQNARAATGTIPLRHVKKLIKQADKKDRRERIAAAKDEGLHVFDDDAA